MSSDEVAISVRDLAKSYKIMRTKIPHRTAIEVILAKLTQRSSGVETFWALNGVSFDIYRGETVGVIGRNGAGKTTLFKLLSRITEPTRGRIDLYGRIGSLIEVGVGFHPELTGRENVFLNGAILGMSTKTIAAQFEAIVEFAGINKFIDTPVKWYSSGMLVRLGFAVAAHLDCEILLVDEVLAVGDLGFQEKCLNKIRDVTSSGRTVLIVSHHMQSVVSLCTKAILLDGGKVSYIGDVEGAVEGYISQVREKSAVLAANPELRPGTGELRIVSAKPGQDSYECGEPKEIIFDLQRFKNVGGKYYVVCEIVDSRGSVIVQCDSRATGQWFEAREHQESVLRIESPWLKAGDYRVNMHVGPGHVDDVLEACMMRVLPILPYPEALQDPGAGAVYPDFRFQTRTG